jgi:hypothetical protein
MQVTSKTNLRFWSSTHGCKNQTLLLYVQLFLSQSSKSSPPRHRNFIKPAFFVFSPHHSPIPVENTLIMQLIQPHSFHGPLHERPPLTTPPHLSPISANQHQNYQNLKHQQILFKTKTSNSFRFTTTSQHTRLQHFLLPRLSLFVPLPSPSSLYLSLFLHEKVRRKNALSLHTATSIGASFVAVDSSAPTRPSVRHNTCSRLSVGDGSEGRRKQQQ